MLREADITRRLKEVSPRKRETDLNATNLTDLNATNLWRMYSFLDYHIIACERNDGLVGSG